MASAETFMLPDPGEAAAAVPVRSQCDFEELECTLPPGSLVRVTVSRARVLRGTRRKHGWGVADELSRQGWQVVGRVWAVNGIGEPSAYLELGERRAIAYWWRTRPRETARAKLAVAAALPLARIGLGRLLCDEGFVFARTPR
jgi:hypothetical protein